MVTSSTLAMALAAVALGLDSAPDMVSDNIAVISESGVSRESQPAGPSTGSQGRAGPGIDCWVGSPPPLPAHSHLYHTYKPLPLSNVSVQKPDS